MASKIVFEMMGFNKGAGNVNRKVNITDNKGYEYEGHVFLKSFYIDDQFKEITFELKEGLEALDYLEQIENELERICFNIITYSEVPTSQPVCYIKMITNALGNELTLCDEVKLKDKLFMESTQSAKEFYKVIMENKTNLNAETKAKYKELFYILHNPHKAIQYIAFYDVLKELVSPPGDVQQKYVTQFLGKNKERYKFVNFVPSNKNSGKNEDSLTFIRNNIAHSKDTGIADFLNITENISGQEISNILKVINDIISENVDIK